MLHHIQIHLQAALILLLSVDTMTVDVDCPSMLQNQNRNGIMERVTHCLPMIVSDKIQVVCEVYALTTVDYPGLPSSNIGIWVTAYFESLETVRSVNGTDHVCLKLIKSRVQKLDPIRDMPNLKDANKYVLQLMTFFPLLAVRLLNVEVSFRMENTVGYSNINCSCVLQHYASDLMPSSCLLSTYILMNIMAPGDNFNFHISVTDLFTRDALTLLLDFMTDLWLDKYNGTINSLALTMLQDFSVLPQKVMLGLAKQRIKKIAFPNNAFQEVSNNDFPLMPSLLELDFSGCDISFIGPKAFDGLTNLQVLDLSRNKLLQYPGAISALINLRKLNMYGNGGEQRDGASSFFLSKELQRNEFSKLEALDLSHMKLANLFEELGKNRTMHHLQYLNLSGTSLNSVPDGALQNMPELILLDLSQNHISVVASDALVGLENLRVLNLSQNTITEINYDVIINKLSRLESLLLFRNDLGIFEPLDIKEHTSFEYLDMSFNKITEWHDSRLSLKNNSLSINLSFNNILSFNQAMLKDFDKLKGLQLSGNTFDCSSCFLDDFKKWIQNSTISLDYNPTRPYLCSFPTTATGKSLLDIAVDESLCVEKVFNWILIVVIPLTTVGVVIAAISTVAFIYRWYILYIYYVISSRFQKNNVQKNERCFKYDAFVSYCSDDVQWIVRHMIPAVEQKDPVLHLCIHERDFEIGEMIMNNIIESIDESHKCIFVLSPGFIRSQWCQWELQMAQHKLFEDRRDVLILVLLGKLDDRTLPKALKRLMKTRTYLIWSEDHLDQQRVFWTRLKHSIGACQCVNNTMTTSTSV